MQITQSRVEKMAWRLQRQAATIERLQACLLFEHAFESKLDSLHLDAG
jgi:hypothetical protein